MFDFAWSEIMLIGVVALIAIGPKDLPVAMKAITEVIKKARRMAGEFQTHVDDMMKEANLDEVRQQINEIRNFDFKGEIERTVDADGTIRQAFDNPLQADVTPAMTPGVTTAEAPAGEAATATLTAEPETPPAPAIAAPDFIPPEYAAKNQEPPAFIPPGIAPPGVYYSSTYGA